MTPETEIAGAEGMDDPVPHTIPDDGVQEVLHAIVRDLQVNPTRYRWFGVWWWPIKAMLIRAGHKPRLGSMLGAATDPAAMATIPLGQSPGDVLAAGLGEYQSRARYDRTPEYVDAPDGDRIRIHDPDIET